MIRLRHKGGVIAKRDLKKVPKNFVAKHSVGGEWLFFESDKEYQDYKGVNFPKTDPVVNEEGKRDSPLLAALKQATPEEIAEFKELLK